MNTSHSFSANLEKYQQYAKKALAVFFKSVRKEGVVSREDIDMLEEFVQRGGKRIRGYLLTLGFRMSGGELNEGVYSFSLGLELAHAGFLIQDDIFDHDMVRRNKDAFHVVRKGAHAQYESIILSDMLVAFGYRMMLAAEIDSAIKYTALKYLNMQAIRTAQGEKRDLEVDTHASLEEIKRIAELKTASYTTHATLITGVLLAEQKEALSLFELIAQNLGCLFQLRDDFLSVFADLGSVGKDVFSDFKEERLTFLTHIIKEAVPGVNISKIETRDQLFSLMSKSEIEKAFNSLVSEYESRINKKVALLKNQYSIPSEELLECVEYVIYRTT